MAALVHGVSASDTQVRRECAKALWGLHAANTADALVGVLLRAQEDHGIQWIAAETLVRQRTRGVRALLRALEKHPDAPTLIAGAHHVFHELWGDTLLGAIIAPVFDALNHTDAAVHAPLAAHSALRALESVKPRPDGQLGAGLGRGKLNGCYVEISEGWLRGDARDPDGRSHRPKH